MQHQCLSLSRGVCNVPLVGIAFVTGSAKTENSNGLTRGRLAHRAAGLGCVEEGVTPYWKRDYGYDMDKFVNILNKIGQCVCHAFRITSLISFPPR
jgi:hypothetical protein